MKHQLKNISYRIIFLLNIIILTACSGGSGGKEPTTPTDPGNPDNGYVMNVDKSTIAFRNEVATPLTASHQIAITYVGEGLLIGFAPGSSAVPWAEYQLSDSTATSATLTINLKDADLFIPGSYETTLRLTTGNISTQDFAYQDIKMTFDIWQVDTATTNVVFEELFGANTIANQTIDIVASGSNWTLSEDASWLSIDVNSGNANQTVTLTADPTQVATAGAFTTTLVLTETDSGVSKEIPVLMALDAVRMTSNYPAVGLYQLTDKSRLSETVNITNNSSDTITWQAESNVTWLSLTLDQINNQLTITKNAEVVADGQYNAEVALTSITNGVAETNTIYIGYHQSTQATSTTDLVDFNVETVQSVAFDPIRPLIYLVGTDKITVHHLFTGQQASAIPTPMQLTHLAISPSGQYLLASANTGTTNEPIIHVYRINLLDQSIAKISLPSENAIISMPQFIASIEGAEIIITQFQEYATLDLTRHYWDLDNAFTYNTVQQAADTNKVTYLRTTNTTPSESSFVTHEIEYNSFADKKININLDNTFTSATYQGAAPKYFDISNQGDVIYTAQNESEWLSASNGEYIENGVLFNTANTSSTDVKTDKQDNSYFYRVRGTGENNEQLVFSLTKYDNAQNQLWSMDIDNGSGSSFINTNFHRFITYDNVAETWFVTSFQD
ncbi:MAG: BACON domain-containing protein [Thalassotalea sp.]